jgi:hypothetical protein
VRGAHCSLLAVAWCLAGCVCTVSQGAQLTAAGWRAARGGGTSSASSSAGVFPPTRGGEAHPPHSEAGAVRGPPPARADGGELTHGELPLHPASRLSSRDAEHASTAAAGDGVWVGGYAGGAVGEGAGGGWVAAGRLAVLSSLRHGAAGVRWVEGRTRCAGEAAGAETWDHRRGHGHAGTVLPRGGVAEVKWYPERRRR